MLQFTTLLINVRQKYAETILYWPLYLKRNKLFLSSLKIAFRIFKHYFPRYLHVVNYVLTLDKLQFNKIWCLAKYSSIINGSIATLKSFNFF